MRFHLLGLAHTKTNREYMPCAYTQKVLKLSKMLSNLGHEVIHYGAEGSEVPCEHVDVISDSIQKEVYGDYDWRKTFFKHDPKDLAYKIFTSNAIEEIKARKKEKDFLLISFGNYQKDIVDRCNIDLSVELGVGYHGVFAKYKVFESYAWLHNIYGQLKNHEPSWYDVVIPNYFDIDDFDLKTKKDDYFAFIGRLIHAKGIQIAIDVCRELDVPLIVAGQGNIYDFNAQGVSVEYRGTVGPEERNKIMGGAKGLFVPTHYIEPFGGVSIEGMLCGTPAITSDFGAFTETNIHGVTGFRCRTFDDFCYAADNTWRLSSRKIRNYAVNNFSMERVALMYQEYFQKLLDLYGDGWYTKRKRNELNWLNKKYP